MWKSDEYYLEKAIEVSRKSRAGGNTPFGCVLVDGDGEIILEQGNVEITEKKMYRTRRDSNYGKSIKAVR